MINRLIPIENEKNFIDRLSFVTFSWYQHFYNHVCGIVWGWKMTVDVQKSAYVMQVTVSVASVWYTCCEGKPSFYPPDLLHGALILHERQAPRGI
jgi:hypothetical protein